MTKELHRVKYFIFEISPRNMAQIEHSKTTFERRNPTVLDNDSNMPPRMKIRLS